MGNGTQAGWERQLAVVMDDLVRIPGTRIGLGVDALLGLFPGVGDLLGSGISGAMMLAGVRARVPIPVLARMAWNIIIDALLGLVPGVGDALDVAHRANRKNYRLLSAALADSPGGGRPTLGYLVAASALIVVPFVLSVSLAVLTIVLVWRWVTG